MGFEITFIDYRYYDIRIENYMPASDSSIAKYLSLTEGEYKEILRSHRAIIYCNNSYFVEKRDAERAVEFLEPYLIMAILTK